MGFAVELKNVTFSYDGKKNILQNVDFTLNWGEFVLLSGLSGEGKSTMLSIINGVIPFITSGKLSGSVIINGQDAKKDNVAKRSRYVGTVMQNAAEQIVYDISADEIAFGCENKNIPQNEIQERIEYACSLMHLNPESFTSVLSGGQQQRLVAASTLAMKQKIIILDEPLANLDAKGADILLKTLRKLADSGCAVLLAEHRLDMALPFADRACRIENKKVIYSADKSAFLSSVKIIENKKPPKKTPEHEKTFLLRAKKLTFNPAGTAILNELDADIYPGERIVLLGENGCGKTTLLRTLARLNKPTGGTLEQNVIYGDRRKKASSKWFSKVGYVYQNPSYQLFMPTLIREISYKAKSEEYALELIQSLGLSGLEQRHPQSLSEGQKRRASIAAICANTPDLLFLDEPTVGQDYDNLERIINLINNLNASNKMTVVTVTHDVRCASAMADRVFIMKDGKIAKIGEPQLATQYLTNYDSLTKDELFAT